MANIRGPSSFRDIAQRIGPIPIDVLGKVAEAVLGGLDYAYTNHKIMHRDLRPSKILINSEGQIKVRDFGTPLRLESSIASSVIGASSYMAPECIQGDPYSPKSEVWGLGLTILELATGKFPYERGDDEHLSSVDTALEFVQEVVFGSEPKLLESDVYPSELVAFIGKCLIKAPDKRPDSHELFVMFPQRTPSTTF